MALISVDDIKSRLLPPSPLIRFAEWLIECLPRAQYKIIALPLKDIKEIDINKGAYKAFGNSPQFNLESETSFESGWYYLEAALTRNSGNREAEILIVGKKEEDTKIIKIPSNLRGSIREVFYIPENTIKIYWSPMSSAGFFTQSPILLHKIVWIESIVRRIFRIVFDFWRFRGTTSKILTVLQILKAIFNPNKAYLESANLRIKRLSGGVYEDFYKHHERVGRKNSRRIRKKISNFSSNPLFTLIILVDMPDSIMLRKTFESIINQLYPHWELLIVVKSDKNDLVSEYENNYTNIISVVLNEDNHFSTAINGALLVASGDFFAVINLYDQLTPHALFYVAKEIINDSDTMMIYTDSDCIDSEGIRSDPCFKPDWNLDMFYSLDYIDNLCFYRTQRVRDIGGYSRKFSGAEEYELTLRFTHMLLPNTIQHISKILYHKYISKTLHQSKKIGRSTSHQSAKKALESLLNFEGCEINDGLLEGLFHIRHPLPLPSPFVSIIIPTKDQLEIFRICIESIIKKTTYKNYEIIVIDNQSENPETLKYFEEIKMNSRIKIYQDNRAFNYSILNNNALKYTKGDVIALLNNDIEVISSDWLEEMVSHAIRPEVGAVGAKLLYPNGKVQHVGVIIGIGGVAGHGQKFIDDDDVGYCYRAAVTHNVSAVTAACLVVRKDVYTQVGGLDENLAVAFNDVDFCLKIRDAGYRNLFTPNAKLFHHESISRGYDDTSIKHQLFLKEFDYMQKKWGFKLNNDPAYNNNLTLELENFSWKIS